MFDIADHLDELRCWPTERLVPGARRVDRCAAPVAESRSSRWCGCSTSGGRSIRRWVIVASRHATVRDKLETARRLESLPEIAAAAYEGALSAEQLSAVTKLADEDSDAEWARRAPNVAPVELARLARNTVKPSTEDSRSAVRGAVVADVVDTRQGDAAAARAVARRDGRDLRGDDPEADRADEAGQGSGVGQLRAPGRRRARQLV